jgi:hypothetical protein
MDLVACIDSLERSGRAIRELYASVPETTLRWKPTPDRWSLLEILGHLLDEETDDFGMRLRLTIESPEMEWPPIDPDNTVIERRHNEADPGELLARFTESRARSLAWLHGLDEDAMTAAKVHPRFGTMRAGDLMASWTLHDLLHLAQIVRTCQERLEVEVEPYSTSYASP